MFTRMLSMISGKDGDMLLEGCSFAVQTILFSRRPGDRKLQFSSEVGTQYCALRRLMVRSALTSVQQDVFNNFECKEVTKGAGEKVGNSQVSDVRNSTVKSENSEKYAKKRKIVRPNWCRLNYVHKKHLDVVQNRMEKTQENGEKNTRKVKDEVEVEKGTAIIVAHKLFQTMTFALTRARARARKVIFEDIGFLYTYWRGLGVQLEQECCKFIWVSGARTDDSEIDGIPEARVFLPNMEANVDEVNSKNHSAWNNMIECEYRYGSICLLQYLRSEEEI